LVTRNGPFVGLEPQKKKKELTPVMDKWWRGGRGGRGERGKTVAAGRTVGYQASKRGEVGVRNHFLTH